MSEDLSAIQMGKKGKQAGKNRKRRVDEDPNEEDISDDGADDGVLRKAKNPGSVFFEVLFKKMQEVIARYSADRDSETHGCRRHVSRQEARRILNNRGYKNESELKKQMGGITMTTAFKKDANDDEVKTFPGPRMDEVGKQTKEFIKNNYPEIWAQYDDEEFWEQQDASARDAFQKAYELWSSSGAEKSDEAAGSRKVSNEDLGLDPDDQTESDEDKKIILRGAGGAGGVGGAMKVLGIVGLDKQLHYNPPEQVLTAKVVAV